ncbi:hypothetical protein ACIPZ5_17755 [Pseudomonas sp. NPDC089428]|uniref:hypothetical protein n=1 Tax=Pseudomonas sp. NPDC089428 TaxID=3364467 RepID=UPI0037F1B38B
MIDQSINPVTGKKAKRQLTDITFEHDGAHVALVHVDQGGPANGVPTLITKAKYSPEIDEKLARLKQLELSQDAEHTAVSNLIDINDLVMAILEKQYGKPATPVVEKVYANTLNKSFDNGSHLDRAAILASVGVPQDLIAQGVSALATLDDSAFASYASTLDVMGKNGRAQRDIDATTRILQVKYQKK